MRLNKTQISALASKICAEINQELKKETSAKEKELKSKSLKCPKIKKFRELLDLIHPEGYNDYNLSYTHRQVLNELMSDYKPSSKTVSRSAIETEIILGTIDQDNLDQLIENIKNNYINKLKQD